LQSFFRGVAVFDVFALAGQALLFLAQPFLFFLFDSLHLLRRCLDKKSRQKVTHDISIVFFVFVNAPHFKAAEKWLQITAFA
jgi:hypothetical protein